MDSEQYCNELKPDNNGDAHTSEWGDIESEFMKMPAGTYYVGDMYFVLSPDMNYELGQLQCHPSLTTGTHSMEGRFKLSGGREIVSFLQTGTQHEKDNDIIFQLQSGSIGITLLAGLEETWVDPQSVFIANSFDKNKRTIIYTKTTMMDYINAVGTVVTYDEEFVCSKCISRHFKNDTQTESIFFGNKVDIFSVSGTSQGGGKTDEQNASTASV
jgi:hypothetical protein